MTNSSLGPAWDAGFAPYLSMESQAEMISGKGTKDDRGKVPLSLMPPEAVFETARVFAFGAKKYCRDNFRNGMDWSRMQDAAERHWKQWQMGEDLDPESGCHHLAHASCCTMMALVYVLDPGRYGKHDDRYKPTQLELPV